MEWRQPGEAMKTAAVLTFFALTASAQAGWQVQTANDRMTDKQVKFATLDAKVSDRGIPATMALWCEKGQRSFTVHVGMHLTRGRLSAAYRVDEGEVMPRFLYVLSDPNRIHILTAPPFDLLGKKRFRVTLMPSGSRQYFYDFDLTGLDEASKAIRCAALPKETVE